MTFREGQYIVKTTRFARFSGTVRTSSDATNLKFRQPTVRQPFSFSLAAPAAPKGRKNLINYRVTVSSLHVFAESNALLYGLAGCFRLAGTRFCAFLRSSAVAA